MSLKDDLLPLIDDLRSIPGELGFRPYSVTIRITTWSGQRVGEGTSTITETRLLVGGQNPKVREVRNKDDVVGNVDYSNTLWEIGPITPAFPGGGYDLGVLNPKNDGTSKTTQYILRGPRLPPNGLICQRTEDDVDRPLRATIRVKSSGRRIP